jgi:DNA polymerase
MSAQEFLPKKRTLPALERAAAACQGCDLYRAATQTVFGEGPATARALLVGEQPGDHEDVEGRPFVGPAGKLLTDVLAEAALPRAQVYITNAVKHYKWEPRGKRRLHKKPSAREMTACRPWLTAEIEVVKPRIVVCLGASAAQQIFGKSFRITQQRGQLLPTEVAEWGLATWHPSAVLRAPNSAERTRMRQELVDDLKRVARHLTTRQEI